MNTSIDRGRVLTRLLDRTPKRRLSEAAQVVAMHRSLIRRAIRRGHSLQTLATELQLPKRTLQRHLNFAGLFFRHPRTNKGSVIRRYRPREKA